MIASDICPDAIAYATILVEKIHGEFKNLLFAIYICYLVAKTLSYMYAPIKNTQ